jgi:segregation and condensation protein B
VLVSIVGDDCNLGELLSLIGQELAARPYEIARMAGGFQYRARLAMVLLFGQRAPDCRPK